MMNPTTRACRRQFLRKSGVTLALPLLHSLLPRSAAAEVSAAPRRMVLINASMGLLPEEFFPTGEGRDYRLSNYLQEFASLREQFTVFSGLSHPEVDGAHNADICFLTGSPHPSSSGFRNTISVDQFAAERIGVQTRVPSLVLHAGGEGRNSKLSWTGAGVNIPAESRPSEIYKRLFVTGNRTEVDAQLEQLRTGRSILDTVSDRTRSLAQQVSVQDRRKLDEYFSSLRELEKRLVTAEEWERTPKPKIDAPMPQDIEDKGDVVGQARLMFQMMKLALETDSTRIISLKVHSYSRVNIPGVDQGHHILTHHGGRPEALKQLRLIETARLAEFRDFLSSLAATDENGESLLDRTAVLYGSHMGDANRHTNVNLPVLLAGGGFKHGQHLVFDKNRNKPLANVYLSMLQRLGIEIDRFASSTGTLTGLEPT